MKKKFSLRSESKTSRNTNDDIVDVQIMIRPIDDSGSYVRGNISKTFRISQARISEVYQAIVSSILRKTK